ncbi:MAG: CBS domain-containing protein [Flavobacteriaceae bacterium]
MIDTEKYIHSGLKPFEMSESVTILQDFFLDNGFSHFPITLGGVYMGCISSDDVETFDSSKKIEDYRYTLEGFFVRENSNWLDVLEKFAQNRTDIMPVLNQENIYLGYYRLSDIVQVFNESSFLREPGGIIVVEKNIMQYSASEIAQIVESNGHKLLGMFISEIGNVVRIYLKTNTENINEILQTFRRYEYKIISEHSEDIYMKSLKERLDYMDKYLNI